MKKIKEILAKYYAAESSLQEEQELKSYFVQNNVVHPDLENDKPLFIALHEESKLSTAIKTSEIIHEETADISDQDILDEFLNEENEASLLEQLYNENGSILFQALKEERSITSKMNEAQFLAAISETDQQPFTRNKHSIQLLRPILRYAAIFMLPLAVYLSYNMFAKEEMNPSIAYLDNIEINENEVDPEEAYKIAREALLFAGSKMKKGQDQFNENVPLLEKTKIFK